MELCIDRITKQYGEKNAVDRFSLTMRKGVYGLLGPNGAGKTTLMRMLAGVLSPTSGEIALGGVGIRKLDESYRDLLGYLPQDFGYYRDFTANDFLLYLSALKGIEKRRAKQKSAELLEAVGLSGEGRSKVKTFSGGMRQRLGIAQALLNDPEILILDEPTAGLDPQERIRFRNLISDMSKNRIVLLCTHIVSDLDSIAEQVVFMKKGRMLKQGTRDAVANEVKGKVWRVAVSEKEAKELQDKYLVANLQHREQGIVLRIIADHVPWEGAVYETPSLEDAYLYFVGNEVSMQ
ncbi:ABC transporter ATP-binding protein [Christensenellaceae bacterium OttesenSCG-928-M15]|nr:ABC transporter ATP-binding protein [Christensenellaceae bacterium OttesenSCG-928-M15]